VLAALRGDRAAIAAAQAALGPLIPASQPSAITLLDRQRAPLLTVGDTSALVHAPVPAELLDAAAGVDSFVPGPIRAAGNAIVGSYVMRVMDGGAVAGYLTQTTRMQVSPSPDELNRLFGGTSTHVRVANRDGSVWTDLARPDPGTDSGGPGNREAGVVSQPGGGEGARRGPADRRVAVDGGARERRGRSADGVAPPSAAVPDRGRHRARAGDGRRRA
jgi:hypothetical protein